MKPNIIIINGNPDSGKGTFCSFGHERYRCETYSSVNKVKKIAAMMGWDGTTTHKNRTMLSALNDFTTKWFDLAYKEMTDLIDYECASNLNYGEDLKNTTPFIFLHIREAKEINRMVDWCIAKELKCYTVFIYCNEATKEQYNHSGDDNRMVAYDICINNNSNFKTFRENTHKLFDAILSGEIDNGRKQ